MLKDDYDAFDVWLAVQAHSSERSWWLCEYHSDGCIDWDPQDPHKIELCKHARDSLENSWDHNTFGDELDERGSIL